MRGPSGRSGVLWLTLAVALFAAHGESQAPPTETLSFTPIADAYVTSASPTRNFGADVTIRADGSPTDSSLLRFTVAGVAGRTVVRARLRLQVTGKSTSGGTIHRISDGTWTEAGVTYNTRPPVDGPAIQTLGSAALNAIMEFNLDGQVTADGTYNFALDTASTDAVVYGSREATVVQPPTLVLTVALSSDPTVTIVQPPDNGIFFVGDQVTFQGTAIDAEDGDLAAAIAWTSNVDGPLGVGASITHTLSQGPHVITATARDSTGRTGSAQVAVRVDPPPPGNTEPLVNITSPIGGSTFTSADSITFTGTANDLEDGSRTAQLVWTSDLSGQIGTGGSFTRTLPVGTHHVTARALDTQGLAGSAVVTITVVAPVTIQVAATADAYVDSSAPTTNFGAATFLRVDGSPIVLFYLRFPVAGIGSRTVSRAILRMQVPNKTGAPSVAGGSVRLIADNAWQEGTVTYSTRPALTGAVLATAGAVKVNDVVDFDVTAAMTGDGTYNFALDSSNSDAADYRSREDGLAPTLILTLTGNPPTVTIGQPADNAVFFRNAPITFSGTASDPEDGNLSAQIQWSSSRDGVLGNGATITRSTLTAGTHAITASATDASSLTGTAQRTIRVRDPNVAPVVTISAPPNNGSAPAGTQVALTATATDDFDGNVTSQIRWSSSRSGFLGVGGSLNVPLAEGAHTLTAAVTDSDGATGSATRTFTITPSPPVVTISAPAAGASVVAGTPVTFSGSASDATDGNLSASLVWTSSLQGQIGTGATFSRSDLVLGTHTITAAATDGGGLTGQATRTLVVNAGSGLPSITIDSPGNGATLFTGTAVQLRATASDGAGGDLAASVQWTSSVSGSLGTGSPLVVPSLAVGTHTITAAVTAGSTTAQATVTVTVGTPTLAFTAVADTYADSSVPTTPRGTATILAVDGSPVTQTLLRFVATGITPFAVQRAVVRLTVGSSSSDKSPVGGNVHRISDNNWTEAATTWNTRPPIDGPTLATAGAVDLNQVVDFDVTSAVTGDGTFNFAVDTPDSNAANYRSREAATGKPQLVVTLKQNTPPAVAVTAPANGTVVAPGASVTFTATATDAEDGNLATQVQWSSSLDGPLGSGGSLSTAALRAGTHVITARVVDSGGASGQASVTLSVGTPPVVQITAPANGRVFLTSELPITLTGTATDAEDGNLGGSIRWSSTLDGNLGMGPSVSATLRVGTHLVTASVTDADHITRQAQITIGVRASNVGPTVAITTPPSGGTTAAGTIATLIATAVDDFDGDISSSIRWSSSLQGDLGTGARRDVILFEGQHTLTASATDSDGVTRTDQVGFTVTPAPPVVAITAPAPGARINQGTSATFTGSAVDATDGNVSASLRWTSDVDGLIGTGPSFTTAGLSVGRHVVTADAIDAGGLHGTAEISFRIVRPPTVTILLPQASSSHLDNVQLTFFGVASDVEDGDVSSSLVWTSNVDGVIGSGRTFSLSGLTIGTHTVTARATGSHGLTGQAQVTFSLSASTLTFAPTADTWVDAGAPTTSFGTTTDLQVRGSPAAQAFLRFVVSGVGPFTVDRALLDLTVTGAAGASDFGGTLNSITSSTWSETTTYNTRPAINGAVRDIKDFPVFDADVVSFTVTTAVTGNGTYNFGLTSPSSDVVVYRSRQATGGRPRLRVFLAEPPMPQVPSVTIDSPVSGATFFDDESISFQASASDPEDGSLTSAITWASSIDGPLGTGGTLATSSLSRGTHTVTASVRDSFGLTATQTVTVTVIDRPPAVIITAPADNGQFPAGYPITLRATATDDVDGDLGSHLVWTSLQDGPLGVGREVTLESLPAGDHEVTAKVANSLGTMGAQTITIFVGSAPPRIDILAPANGSTVPEGTPITLVGSATDLEDGNLSATIAWSSDRQGLLGTGAVLPVMLAPAGAHRIRATATDSHGFVRVEEITVVVAFAPPVVTITAPANGSSAAGPVTVTGTALDVRDGNLSAGLVWTSSRDGALGVGATVTANLSGGVHVITATRTDSNGLTGSAAITVAIGNAPPVVTITAPASGATRIAGQAFTFTGTAVDAVDGNLGARLAWSSNIVGPLGTGASISIATLARGTHVITARATDNAGLSALAQIQVQVTASTSNQPPVLAITAPADGTSVSSGTAVTFSATAIDDLGGNVASKVNWVSSLDGLIGSGGSFTTSTLAPGTHTITAMVIDAGGLMDSKTVLLTVTAGSPTFTAVADAYTDSDVPTTNFGTTGSLQGDATPVRHIFLRFNVTGVSGAVARAIVRLQTTAASDANSPDGGTIRAVSNNTWGETTITSANEPAIDGAALASAGAVAISQTVDLDVTPAVPGNGTYSFGITSANSNIVKYASREAAAGKPQLVVILQGTGTGRPTVAITAPANGARLPNGTSTTFTATATDPQDGDVTASLVWQSNVDGQIGTGPTINRTLTPGVHQITARATDSGGNASTALINVFVTATAPQVAIVSPAPGAVTRFGDPTSLVGTAVDPQQNDLSFGITWSSSVDGPLGTGPSFTRILSPGAHVITAQVTDGQGGVGSATAAVTVSTVDVGYRDTAYPANATAGSDEITSSKPESKLWYNDGVWWATLFNTAAGVYRIHRLDWATQTWADTGVQVDERKRARQDVLWDGQKLYVVSRFADTPAGCRFYRFSYYADAKLYVLDQGYPVDIPGGATESITLAKDSQGRFWVAFTLNEKVWTAHSLADDRHWSAPYVLPVPEGTSLYFDDIAGVVALPGRIGIFWSNQLTDKDYFAVHTDGAPDTAWSLEIPVAGSKVADDHFNLKLASDGRLFVAMKTSRDGANGQTLIGLLVRSATGVWSTLNQVMPNDFNPTRAQLLLDEAQRRVYVFYSPMHATIHYKASSMDTIAFPTGIGTPFIAKPDVSDINDPTTTKQNIDPSTGMVVLASNFVGTTKSYYHNAVAPLPAPAVAITAPATGGKRAAGTTLTFSGTASSADLGDLTASLRWTSSLNGQIGTGGSFSTQSLSPGAHVITASVTDARGVTRSASIALVVETNVAPVVAIQSPQNNKKFLSGATVTFNATALDSLDGDRSATLVWTSSISGQIGTGPTLTRSDLPLGTHVVTARATDTSGLQGSATVTVVIETSSTPTVAISAPTNGKVVAFGAPLTFTGTANDVNDGNLTSAVVWTSNLDGNIGQGGSFVRGTLRRGAHTITARVTDSSGLSATATRSVQVVDEAAPVVTIAQPAAGSVFGDVKPISFAASAVDAIDGNVAATLIWTSNLDGQIGTGATFTRSGLSVGTHVITASAHDTVPLTGIDQITIEVRDQTAPTVTITQPADNAFILSGDSTIFTATAVDTVDGSLDGTITWVSDRDGVLGTGASITRILTAGTHQLTASARNSGDLTGTASITVVVGP